MTAKMSYKMNHLMWKKYDYRCLKPKTDTKPEKWPHYDMVAYRAAKTKEEMEKVKEIKFDKYFFNFEDTEVFEKMVKGKQREKIWKRTYGFDYVSFNYMKTKYIYTRCFMNCLKAELKSFARKCRKKGGVFKCCLGR